MKELFAKLIVKVKEPKFIGPIIAMVLAGLVTMFADFKPILHEVCVNVLSAENGEEVEGPIEPLE